MKIKLLTIDKTTTMKIIFCDIDGVLNSYQWNLERPDLIDYGEGFNVPAREQYPFYEFSPKLIKNLNTITDTTGAKIVVSSAWRDQYEIPELSQILKWVGVTGEIIDYTPSFFVKGYFLPRGCEIDAWLKKHKDVTSYVILDDNNDMLLSQKRNFVETSPKFGLTKDLSELAIEILQL